MLEKEPKQGKKFQYLRIYNSEKIWSRIHQVFGPEFTWSPKYLVPNSPLGPEFTWSRIHLVPTSPDTGCGGSPPPPKKFEKNCIKIVHSESMSK